MKKLSLIAVASLVLSACASTTHAPVQTEQSAPMPAAKPAQTHTLTQAEIDAQTLAAQLKDLQNKSVYFDFDKFDVKADYSNIVHQQADFMSAHPADSVTLQGNADERGSDEYNLALGEKRADAVGKMMKVLGIPASRISTASFGEEKPRLTCHEEKCWKENRRVDFAHKLAN